MGRKMNTDISEKQRLILNFIIQTKSINGYAPTIREIGTALDIKSTCTVHAHLQMLKRFGYLSTGEGKARILQVSSRSTGMV